METTNLSIHSTNQLNENDYDSFVIVANNLENDLKRASLLDNFGDLQLLKELNSNFESEVTFTVVNKKRVVYSPTGPLNRDYDDVRRVADATKAGINKAKGTGSRRPLLINLVRDSFELADHVALLAALEVLHIPLEIREANNSSDLLKVDSLGFWHTDLEAASRLLSVVKAVELGRIVTRDIGGSDPERMSAPNVHKYVEKVLKSSGIHMSVVHGQENFEKDYPCFAAVNRAANATPRHHGRIIKLTYTPEGTVDTTLILVGKGITYDTGGADIKYGGHMAGMHRDKCGAAFVAGFFKTLSILKPKGLKVMGTLCLARNSVGEECYVADEIITSRANKRIRVGNTDAEGRMVMVDALCEAKERALNETNPFLFTIATLTGHVIRAYGEDYTAIVCNGPSRAQNVDKQFFSVGEAIADPYEISTLRREDYKMIAGPSEYEDILQCNNAASTMTSRGHQFPAAFLIAGSGLDKHGIDSDKQIPYAHIDIAGSSGPFPGLPTASPLPSFVYNYVLPRL